MQKTWPHAGLNLDLPSVSLTLYRYSNRVRDILRFTAVYIRGKELFLSVG